MSHAGVKNVIWTECSINCGLELVSNLIWLGLMELGTNLCKDFTIKEKNFTKGLHIQESKCESVSNSY